MKKAKTPVDLIREFMALAEEYDVAPNDICEYVGRAIQMLHNHYHSEGLGKLKVKMSENILDNLVSHLIECSKLMNMQFHISKANICDTYTLNKMITLNGIYIKKYGDFIK